MNIKGIVHVGAHYGEEIQEYVNNGIQNITIFEPLSNNFDVLAERLQDVNADIQGYQVALGSKKGKATMYLSSNEAQSSSILKPKDHLEHHPDVTFDGTEEVEVDILDDYELREANFMNIDVQGYELEVFKGATKTLKSVDYIYCEVNRGEMYEGNPMVEELDDFLGEYGFERVETHWPETWYKWGDALYIKSKKRESTGVIDYFTDIVEKISSYNEDRLYEKPTDLCETFNSYGSDKGNNHNYSTFYNHIFSHIKENKLNVFELGLGTGNPNIPSNMGSDANPGASHLGFRDYFLNSNIYGADIDSECLIQDTRVKTYFVDQTNPSIIEDLWCNSDLYDVEFDILIDDGLHEFYANKIFFENSIHKLKKGGVYIIEDIKNEEIPEFNEWISSLSGYQHVQMVTLQHPLRPYGAQVGTDDDILDNRIMVLVK
jgi:FkbM family methyltransferase